MTKRCNLKCPRCSQPLAIHPASKLGNPVYIHRHRAPRQNKSGNHIHPLYRCMYIFAALTPVRMASLITNGFISVPLQHLQELNPETHKPTAHQMCEAGQK